MLKRFRFLSLRNYLIIFISVAQSLSLSAAEISAVSGFFQSSSSKNNGSGTGGASKLSLGSRYSEVLDGSFHWFGQANMALNNYSSGSGTKSPSNSVGLALQGGLRLYFDAFSDRVIPYSALRAGFVSEDDYNPATDTQNSVSGLFYYGDLGLRVDLDSDFFVDLETTLFSSALFATRKRRQINAAVKNEQETTYTGLYISSSGSLSDSLKVAFGFKF